MRTALSSNFEIKFRLLTGLYFLKILSNPDFLSKGFTKALFQMHGKIPEIKYKLITMVISGRKTSGYGFSSLGGMVSNKHVVGFALDRSHLISPRETALKDDILGRSFGNVKGTFR